MLFNDIFNEHINKRDKQKIVYALHKQDIFELLLNTVIPMLEYKNCPDSFNPDFAEMYKYSWGYCGVGMVNNELVVAKGSRTGNLDNYGMGTEFVGNTLNGNEMRGIIGKDIIILRNNKTYRDDFNDLIYYAEQICGVDVSEDVNVYNTQLSPLVSVDSQQKKEMIDKWYEDRRIGMPLTMVKSEKVGADFLDQKPLPPFETVNLSDPDDVNKLQYLSRYRDDIMRRFFNQYGFSMSTGEKMAQQTTKEISMNDAQALIYPYQRYLCAKEDIDKVNALFNTNISVDFSILWKMQLENVIMNKESEDEDKGFDGNSEDESGTTDTTESGDR